MMSTHLLDGTVHHVDEEQSDGLTIYVLHFAIVLVNVVLDSSPEGRGREEGREGGSIEGIIGTQLTHLMIGVASSFPC